MKFTIALLLAFSLASVVFAGNSTENLRVKRRYRQVILTALPMKEGKVDMVAFLSTAAGAKSRLQLNEKGMAALNDLMKVSLKQENKFIRNWKRFLKDSATYGSVDVETLIQQMMMEMTLAEDAELRDLLNDMNAILEKKKTQRDKLDNQKKLIGDCAAQLNCSQQLLRSLRVKAAATQAELDSISDLTDEQQMKLQIEEEKREKAMEMQSNLIKKLSETANNITENMK